MVSSRKRALRDIELDEVAQQAPSESDLLQPIRNSWQFANLFQWIYLFGRAVKIDENIDIDVCHSLFTLMLEANFEYLALP